MNEKVEGEVAVHPRGTRSPVLSMALTHACGAMRARAADWHTIADALEEKAQACRALARGRRGDALLLSPWFASQIVKDWHRLPQFVDQSGEPRALKLWGAADSVEAIGKLHCKSSDMVKRSVRALKSLGGCRQVNRGRYVPVSYEVILSKLPEALDRHAEQVFACMIETIEKNRAELDQASRDFERLVRSERLGAQHVPAFRHFMQAQGMAMLEAVDEWLEERQVNAREPGVEVVVELFSHVASCEGRQVGDEVTSPWTKEADVPVTQAFYRENSRRMPRPRGRHAARGEAR
jgi:hypothetical protein